MTNIRATSDDDEGWYRDVLDRDPRFRDVPGRPPTQGRDQVQLRDVHNDHPGTTADLVRAFDFRFSGPSLSAPQIARFVG